MQAIHKTLLEVNKEFLVSEAPATPLLKALLKKNVLTSLDLQQLSNLEAQGARAVKRFVLQVLPLRGPLAYPALLEALQEANAQHLVDLLLEGEAVLRAAVKPIELPEPSESRQPQEDPNEYARKLRANRALIEEAVDPHHLISLLIQNGVLTSLEEALLDSLQGQHILTWSILWGVLLQRGVKAYQAFKAALLHHGYSALFHTIEETKVTGTDALKLVLARNMMSSADIRARAAPALHHKNNDNDDFTLLPLIVARKERVTTPQFRSASQQSMVSLRSFGGEVALPPISAAHNNSRRRPQENQPRSGSYSLGSLDFLYTPKSEKLMQLTRSRARNPSPLQVSTSATDLFYNPAWSDAYNHLRGTDVAASPKPGYRSSLSGTVQENGSDARPYSTSDPASHPSRHPYLDQNRGGKNKDHEIPTSALGHTEDAIQDELLAKLEAISEKDAESEVGSHHANNGGKAGEHSADHPPDHSHDHTPDRANSDPESAAKRFATSERSTVGRTLERDPDFTGILNQETYHVAFEKNAASGDQDLQERNEATINAGGMGGASADFSK